MLVFSRLVVSYSFVWGLVILRLGVGDSYVWGVRDSYIWALSLLTFGDEGFLR